MWWQTGARAAAAVEGSLTWYVHTCVQEPEYASLGLYWHVCAGSSR